MLSDASSDHLNRMFLVRSVRGLAIIAKSLTKMRWKPATPKKACTSFLFLQWGRPLMNGFLI